eukprot:362965-Chlamydomonas_euryale.AAC.2
MSISVAASSSMYGYALDAYVACSYFHGALLHMRMCVGEKRERAGASGSVSSSPLSAGGKGKPTQAGTGPRHLTAVALGSGRRAQVSN